MPHGPTSVKVLQVSNYAPPHPGGIEKIAAQIFGEMRKRGVAIRWLMSDAPKLPPEPDTIRVRVLNQMEDRFGMPIFFPFPSAYAQLFREVKACDIVHIHDGYYLTCAAAALFAKLFRKRLVMTIHIWEVPYKSAAVRFCQRLAMLFVVRPCIRGANVRVTYNRWIFRNLEKLGVHPRFIPNGIDPAFNTPVTASRADLLARHGLPPDKPIAIFAGRYSEKKGLPIVREIARTLPGICFVMCGSGPESPDQWQLPNVVNMGWTKADKLKELFSCANLFLLPSRGEGFPLAIQEAMSCGLPCAVFDETWSALGEKREFFVILEDFATPAEGVDAFFQRGDTKALNSEIAAYTEANWTVDAMIDAYQEVYSGAMEAQ
jgi:glycosyltransferase involved in cell wall biosynthesis